MSEIQPAYLIDAVRTPFGRYRGGLAHVRTDDLAAAPVAELMQRNTEIDPATVDDVYLGNTNGAGEENRNVARMAALLAGLPVTVPGATVNRLCASGSEAVIQATRAIATGDASVTIVGGVEGMSRAPYVLPRSSEAFQRTQEIFPTTVGWRMVNPKFPSNWVDSLGGSAESVAQELGISRQEQDEWAARSHQRASAAWDAGLHTDYVMSMEGVERDESIRPATTVEVLSKLRPAFTPSGSVTAGNSSPINDGALAALVTSGDTVASLGLTPMARILGAATVATEPDRFSVAPVDAINKLLTKANLEVDDIDLWEINEAFAAMVLSTLTLLPHIDRELVNVNGGAIAIGHPLGASAPRVLVDLCRELRRRGGGVGVAAACVGVGLGQAVLVHVE